MHKLTKWNYVYYLKYLAQVVNLGNYEVQFDYFPIRFKPDFETPTDEKEWVQTVHWRAEKIDLCDYADNVDFLLLWGTTENKKILKELQACYELIESESDLKLYKPKLLSDHP